MVFQSSKLWSVPLQIKAISLNSRPRSIMRRGLVPFAEEVVGHLHIDPRFVQPLNDCRSPQTLHSPLIADGGMQWTV